MRSVKSFVVPCDPVIHRQRATMSDGHCYASSSRGVARQSEGRAGMCLTRFLARILRTDYVYNGYGKGIGCPVATSETVSGLKMLTASDAALRVFSSLSYDWRCVTGSSAMSHSASL